MRPDVPRVLLGIAATLATKIVPELQTPFAIQNASHAAALVGIIAQEFDRAAARLVEENESVRALLAEGRSLPLEAGLDAAIEGLLSHPPAEDYHVSALQAGNDTLRAMLIRLHEAVERLPGQAAADLDHQIWDELRESTRRRHVAMASG